MTIEIDDSIIPMMISMKFHYFDDSLVFNLVKTWLYGVLPGDCS